MSRRVAVSLVALTALAAFATLAHVAPEYVPSQGFPLDDAWIHAVYARALARTGTLSYNPGVPATGVTSPLWTVVFAVPHLISSAPGTVVVLTKLIGFALHLVTAVLFFFALGAAMESAWLRAAGACLVAFDPDLIAGAVSGMEIPLATLFACALMYAARRPRFATYALLCVLAPLARPELALLCFTIPFLQFALRDRRQLQTALSAAVVGTAISFGLLAIRNLVVSGFPLPATFYAKVGQAQFPFFAAQFIGFSELLGRVVILDSSILVTAMGVISLVVLFSRDASLEAVDAAAAFSSGLVFCAVSFILISPDDPPAFYHQRYVLPVLPLMVGTMPLLADTAMRWCLRPLHRRVGGIALIGLLSISLIVAAPPRYRRLANDAHNIDDLQVAIGRALSSSPASNVVWATDAGAIRYFGRPFVVDLIGLNTPGLLGPHPQAVLNAHRPRYLEIVPGWIGLDEASQHLLEGERFTTSTPYTVTSSARMGSQWLVRCPPELTSGNISLRLGHFHFSCAS